MFPSILNFLDIALIAPESSMLYTGGYDTVLVSLSIAVAIFASYASLLVSQYVSTIATAGARGRWIAVGGLCLGAGIWTMHFVGMLAFDLPCSTGYDATLTLLSMIPGILASTLALKIISRREVTRAQLATGGLLIGAGIGAMHYSGMAAMRLDGLIRYDLKLFLLSVLVAVALATLALWIKFRLQTWRGRWQAAVPVASAVVMGMAVSGMHYTAMAAAYFVRGDDMSVANYQLGPTFLATIVLAVTGVIIVVTLVATHVAKPGLFSLGQAYKPVGVLIAGWSVIAWVSANYYYNLLTNDLYQQEKQLAAQQAANVASNIEKSLQLLKGVPVLLSRTEEVRRVLRRFGENAPRSTLPYEDGKRRWTQDQTLRELSQSLGVAATHLRTDAIWLVNSAGDCIAASNTDEPTSFVGTNYADREYFREALAGQAGQQYAVGRASKVPGLFYSYPVMENGRFLGAVVVKRNISDLSHWTTQANAFIADVNGVIVLAPDKELEFLALPNAAITAVSAEKRQLQYRQSAFEPLSITPWEDQRFSDVVRIGAGNQPVVLATMVLSEDAIAVYVPRPLGGLLRLGPQRHWLFLLLMATGSMLIVTASAVVLYLRASRKAEADLRVAATAFESQEGMVITDAENTILRVNRAFTEMTGYTAEEALGQKISLLKSDRHDAAFYEAMWASIRRTGSWQGEIWDRRKTGEVYPKWLTITAVKGRDGIVTHYVGAHTDITQRKAAEDEIKHLAFYDPLTRLPNRRLLLDRLQRALAASARSRMYGALLFIDLDHFKTLNDTLGHDKGDLLLQQVAERLANCVRADDTVARLGGDEFVAMLERLSENPRDAATRAEAIAEKIRAALSRPYDCAGHEHHGTQSIGVALFGDQGERLEEVLKRADLAMYQAKGAGRNTVRFFDPEMQATVNTRAALEADLRDALEGDQLCLYYQVQVDSAGHPTGAESLVRWRHPERGLVSPGEFIPLAEETGLILPLGLRVLEVACAQLTVWAQAPNTAHLTMAVNVSARQFRHPDFVEQVLAAIDRNHVDPQKLKLELTESTLAHDTDEIIAKMSALKARGVGFSLDDFGTGYSSLAYLKRLPLDQLKIDQSFVRDLLTDPNDAAIAKTIIDLANSMALAVIAEGVETEAQRDALAESGCRAYQGYLFGKPLPPAEFERSLTTGRKLCAAGDPTLRRASGLDDAHLMARENTNRDSEEPLVDPWNRALA